MESHVVKFGLFYEISVPRPRDETAEFRVYQNALEQVRLADELGFDYVWAVEHHFLDEHSHCSAPELFLTACAMQTKRIRVGHGIVVCVPEINHPIRLAERAATLDLLSAGRLEFGTGRATTWNELGGFLANPDRTKKTWDEYVRVIPRMWTEEQLSYRGESFSMPLRSVLPKPFQKPHPPMWVSVSSAGTEIDAAERGLGALFLSLGGYAEQEARVREYRRRVVDCEPAGAFVNNQVALVNFLYCHADSAQGMSTGRTLASTYSDVANQNMSVREVFPTVSYPSRNPQYKLRAQLAGAGDSAPLPEGLCAGDPSQIIAALKGWEAVGIDTMNFLINCLEFIPQEQILESLRLFAREVMPHFAEPARSAPLAVTR
jgi:alkanesulfonate monooxygenase SsuD/methylene tetrahydromethanopterin reductase-like flavin-dependent oxidoreductase (luciferase family)